MPSYLVTWTIDSDAPSPREAAEDARAAMTRKDTTATVFDVTDKGNGKRYRVDLDVGAVYHRPPDPRCVDVSRWPQLGPYIVAPAAERGRDWQDGVSDFRDGIYPIWCIARAEKRITFEFQGVEFIVPAGSVLLSRAADLYQREGFDCIWLR